MSLPICHPKTTPPVPRWVSGGPHAAPLCTQRDPPGAPPTPPPPDPPLPPPGAEHPGVQVLPPCPPGPPPWVCSRPPDPPGPPLYLPALLPLPGPGRGGGGGSGRRGGRSCCLQAACTLPARWGLLPAPPCWGWGGLLPAPLPAPPCLGYVCPACAAGGGDGGGGGVMSPACTLCPAHPARVPVLPGGGLLPSAARTTSPACTAGRTPCPHPRGAWGGVSGCEHPRGCCGGGVSTLCTPRRVSGWVLQCEHPEGVQDWMSGWV